MIKDCKKCTCDICKKQVYVEWDNIKSKDDIPLRTISLPCKTLTEPFSNKEPEMIINDIDVCDECLKELHTKLSESYCLQHDIHNGKIVAKGNIKYTK